VEKIKVSERRVCRLLGQPRSTQRRKKRTRDDEEQLKEEIVKLACQYGRYGYRRITALLKDQGWKVNHKRVERIWKQEGLKVPRKQPKRRRLWLNDGSCLRLRPQYRNHVWSYDFVVDRTSDGRAIRMLTIIDEYSRECLSIHIQRQIKAPEVLYKLSELFITKGIPDHIRSDNGSEFTAKTVRSWLERLGVKTLFIEPGSPWENGYIESFNGKLRDELLNGEIFDTILEAKVITENWRNHYNKMRPHSSLGYKAPAPEAILPIQYASA
jgi:transposase InsO family protein